MAYLYMTEKSTPVQLDRNLLRKLTDKFPSLQFFHNSDDEALLDMVNSLVIMDHLIDGTKKDYAELIRLQQRDVLTFSSFRRLSNFFYPFRYRPDLRRLLELFIFLDGISRTEAYKKLIRFSLPADQCNLASRDHAAISIIKYKLLAEIRQLGDYGTMTLRLAFAYRQFITGQAPGHVVEFTDDATRIAQAGAICDIASLPRNHEELGASQLLTEGMVEQLLDYIERRNCPQVARELCSLAAG